MKVLEGYVRCLRDTEDNLFKAGTYYYVLAVPFENSNSLLYSVHVNQPRWASWNYKEGEYDEYFGPIPAGQFKKFRCTRGMVVDDVVFQYGNVYYVFYLPDGRVLLHSDREGSIDVTGRTLPDFQETFSSKIADAKLMGVLLVALVAVMFLTIFNVPNILLLILSLFLFVAFIVYRSHQVSEQEFRYRLYEERMTEQSKGD